MSNNARTLGAVLRALRARNGWTLKEMSQQCGIPISTLSKVEHDRLTLTYDKLQQISERLKIRMSELFDDGEALSGSAPGRRSIGTLGNALRVDTANYDHYYLCTELRSKRMIPCLTKHHARTMEEFGDLIRHPGEEFLYVVSGKVAIHTEFYDPIELIAGQSIYIDSGMGHAYLLADGCDEAVSIAIMSSGHDDDLLNSLVHVHGNKADAHA